jgi:SH3 domain-containing YSC84-like protein 1
MKRPALLLCGILLLSGLAFGATSRAKDVARLNSAATILDEVMAAPDKGIPNEVIGSAKCIAVVPSLLKGGFVGGVAYGHGVATCRTDKGWSAPAFFSIKGGSFGLQIGGEAVDLVMLFMNDQGMQALLNSQFKIGGDASAAAGPVGRHVEGSTDWKMTAEILTYSRARGIFAGITVNGSLVKQDREDTRQFYGRMVTFRTLLTGAYATPPEAKDFLQTVTKYAGTNAPMPPTPPPAPEPPPTTPPATTTTPPPPSTTAPPQSPTPPSNPTPPPPSTTTPPPQNPPTQKPSANVKNP